MALLAATPETRIVVTLAEEIVLLLLDEQNESFLPIQEAAFKCALTGAVLMELAFANRIDTDLQTLMVIDRTPTGNPMLDRILERISGHVEASDTHQWVEALSSEEAITIREQAVASLVERGILNRERRFPGILRTHRYAKVDGAAEREIKQHIRGILESDDIPDPRDVALICLVDACNILTDIFPRQEVERAGPRIEQLHVMDLIGREVASTIAETKQAIISAVRARATRFERRLLAFAIVGSLATVAILVLPRVPIPDRFGPGVLELLWFDEAWKQWSGYTLLALSTAALLVGGFMKTRLAVGLKGHDWWPLIHVSLGVSCVLVLFAHTGFRFGANLNAALMGNYLALLLLGALAGILINKDPRIQRLGISGRLRRLPVRLHLLVLLPLPTLLAIHILLVYLY